MSNSRYTRNMKIEFYYDPSCPWCWVTSRWLVDVTPQRNLSIDWKPFSLALKNNEMSNDDKAASPHGPSHRESHRVMRVIEAAAAAGADRGKLYGDIGRMHHVEGYRYTDTEIELMLSLSELDTGLLSAADDTRHDDALRASLDEAIAIVGDDVGVPIIAFVNEDGSKTGYFGPVLTKQPTGDEALKLWDGLATMATIQDFYELKRTLPAGGPDTGGSDEPMVC